MVVLFGHHYHGHLLGLNHFNRHLIVKHKHIMSRGRQQTARCTGRGRRRPVPKYEPTPQTTPPELARHYGTDSMDAEMSYSPAYEGGQHEDSAAIPRPLSNAQVMELIAQMDKTLQLDDTDSPAPETTPVTAPVIGHTPRVKVYERVLTLWLNRLGPDGSLINDDPQPPESPTQGLSKM